MLSCGGGVFMAVILQADVMQTAPANPTSRTCGIEAVPVFA
jgi:hypothetical protein